MNGNGYITAPINLKNDVYYVLKTAPSGSRYSLTEACTSNKINRWSKYKPYITKDNKYKSIPYGTIQFIKEDGTIVNITEDPSKEGDNGAQVFWGLNAKPSSLARSGKQLKDWLLTYFSQYTWEYQKPVVNVNWMRLTDFEYYRHNAEAPVIIEPHTDVKELIDSTGNLTVVNLFPNANFAIEFDALPGNNNGFVSTLEFFQRQPELRFTVEMWPHVSAKGNWTEAVYPDELLGKWFSRTLLYDEGPRFMMNVRDCLDYLYGVDNYWHIGKNGPTVNFMLALQEANGNPNEEIFFNPNNNSVPAGNMTVVTTDPSVEGTIIPAPGYVGFYGNPGFRWPIQFGCWFDRNLTDFKWGYKAISAPQPTMQEGNSETSGQVVGVNNRNLYVSFEVETKSADSFYLLSYSDAFNNQTNTQKGVWFAAVCENADNKIPVVATVFSSNNESAWYGDTSYGSHVQIMGSDGNKVKVYLRFNNFWEKPYSGGCRIKLYVSMVNNPTVNYNSQAFLDDWFAADEFVYFPNGSQMGNYLQTDVYYLEK